MKIAATLFLVFMSLCCHVQAIRPQQNHMNALHSRFGVSFDVSPRGVYFNRKALPQGVSFQNVIEVAIDAYNSPRPRFVFVLDTNYGPHSWQHNMIDSEQDQLYGATPFHALGGFEVNYIFANFAERILQSIESNNSVVGIVDHHYRSQVLGLTSTTPLLFGFVRWLQKSAPESTRERLYDVFRNAVLVRDHADPDILLANTVFEYAHDEATIAKWGRVWRDVALLNDHGQTPVGSDFHRALVRLGFLMLRGAEREVPKEPQGFYQSFIDDMPFLFAELERVIHANPGATDEIKLASLQLRLREVQRAQTRQSIVRGLSYVVQELSIEEKMNSKMTAFIRESDAHFRKMGPLLLAFWDSRDEDVPGGTELYSAIATQSPKLLVGSAVLAQVTREKGAWHVRLRAGLHGGLPFSLNTLWPVLTPQFGGGGRETAGRLYAPVGRDISQVELFRDLQKLESHLTHALQCSTVLKSHE